MKLSALAGALALASLVLAYFLGPLPIVVALIAFLVGATMRIAMRVPHRAYFPAALLAFGLLLGVVPAFAQGTAVDVGGIYGAWEPYILAVLAPLVAAGIGLLAELLRRKFNLDIEAKHRDALQTAVTNAAGLALSKLGNTLDGKTIDVKNAAIAAAVTYVGKGAPAALAKFGLGPDDIKRMIEAKLPQVANTAAKA